MDNDPESYFWYTVYQTLRNEFYVPKIYWLSRYIQFSHQEVKVAVGEGEVKEGVVWSEAEEVETVGEEEVTWGWMMITTETWTTG